MFKKRNSYKAFFPYKLMSILVACLSSGKGTWGHVTQVIKGQDWDKIILVTNDFGKENYKPEKEVDFILIDPMKGIKELRDNLTEALKEKINDVEVGLNLVSGSGKEHMALISAILKLGYGIRLIALTSEGVEEI